MKDCSEGPAHERRTLLKKHAKEKVSTGPAKNVCSERWGIEVKQENRTVNHGTTLNKADPVSFDMTFGEGAESNDAQGRADDGAHESLVSSRISEQAVLNGIGKMKKVKSVTMKVTVKTDLTR